MGHKARLAEFDSILQADHINLTKLQELSFTGIPDEGGRRALCWCLMLHYLPLEKATWEAHLTKKRKHYNNFVEDIIIRQSSTLSSGGTSKPSLDEIVTSNKISSDVKSNKNVTKDNSTNNLPDEGQTVGNSSCSDHPLNLSPDSEWGGFFKDNEILSQIDKDVKRLCPDMCFFQRPTQYPQANIPRLSSRVTYSALATEDLSNKFSLLRCSKRRATQSPPDVPSLPPGSEAHWEVLERVLFIYAKLNPGQGYVQGMNEIIGPLYYVLATAPSHAEHAEADCFWLFTAVMTSIRDLFIRTLDDSESGIGRLMSRLMVNLAQHDTATSSKLKEQGIREQYFAFRWLSLLFSQEFPLPDVIRVWDGILSRDDAQHSMLLHFATAMIIMQRKHLLAGDFAANMQLLQNYPPCDVVQILNLAAELSAS